MDGFSYVNIFETKGIEYIAIITFFIVLVPFWILLNRDEKLKQKIKNVLNILSFDILKIPEGVFHSKNHTWAYMEKSGTASVGVDDFLTHVTGTVKLKSFKNSGEKIKKGELLVEAFKDDNTLQIFSPITGEIIKSNSTLNENPRLLNEDPYGKGWLYKIKPTKWVEESNSFYLAEETENWAKNEINRFKDFLGQSNSGYATGEGSPILQDGGELVDNVLSTLPNNIWIDFQHNFLNN